MAKLDDRCFSYFTAAMFVSLWGAQTWRFHIKLYKFEWNTSPNNERMKTCTDLNLGEVVYMSIIFRIPASWLNLLNGYDFYFDGVTLQTSHNSFYTAISQWAWQMTCGTTRAWYGMVRAGSWRSSKMAKENINQLGFVQVHLIWKLKVTKYYSRFTLVVVSNLIDLDTDSRSESLI